MPQRGDDLDADLRGFHECGNSWPPRQQGSASLRWQAANRCVFVADPTAHMCERKIEMFLQEGADRELAGRQLCECWHRPERCFRVVGPVALDKRTQGPPSPLVLPVPCHLDVLVFRDLDDDGESICVFGGKVPGHRVGDVVHPIFEFQGVKADRGGSCERGGVERPILRFKR